jgi:hypothetical protein
MPVEQPRCTLSKNTESIWTASTHNFQNRYLNSPINFSQKSSTTFFQLTYTFLGKLNSLLVDGIVLNRDVVIPHFPSQLSTFACSMDHGCIWNSATW